VTSLIDGNGIYLICMGKWDYLAVMEEDLDDFMLELVAACAPEFDM
jgi:hypothetical protein